MAKAKEATKKRPVPRLNKAGIRLVADALVAHKKRYDQDNWGNKNECGTFCCLAGFCLLNQVGTVRKFNALLKSNGTDDEIFEDICLSAGLKELGIKGHWGIPQIFDNIWLWPKDLVDEYESNGPTWRVIAALKALQRLLPNGDIDNNPKKVHTRLPQLAALLATAKPMKKKIDE